MSKLDEKVGQYLDDLKSKIGESNPDVDLLRKIAESLGPAFIMPKLKQLLLPVNLNCKP